MQLRRLLFIGLSALSVAEASYIHIGVNVPHHKNLGALARRADEDSSSADVNIEPTIKLPTPETTSSKAAPVTTTSVDPPAETSTTSKAVSPPPVVVTTTSSPAPVTTTTKPSNNDQPPVTTANPNGDIVSSTKGPLPTPSSSASGSDGSSNNDNQDTKSSTSVKPIIKTITQVITTTNEQGVATTMTSEALTTSTPPPGFASEKNSDKSGGGMSTQTRNIVIGVVVGVGGAIVLAGLGIVAWRIWGRKRQSDEADNLMEYNDAGKPEVGGSMAGRTPFQSTLESYHAPTHVNQASNF
ncbi:hypothetical protein QBC32DRAFT_152745 [Pseudoneurospora amorphoporcata]|uniref:Mid2 domain-containing protein n=1 Tax=Pseudoneurospora amorphoporcata TaxID=241081 RepID=A0AAN6NTT4_9PEZI|nr:hypothetical protein QBC32DRAFT_152745 [Pseudoneurospora amorphoporcata]